MAYFQTKNSNLGKFWGGRCRHILRPFSIFCKNLVYLEKFLYIWWLFGIFHGYLVYWYVGFWYVVPRKIWQPWP
jgi:hypothetical protein